MAKKQLGTTPANTIDATTKGYVDGGLSAKQSTSEKGQANGYASLDTNGKVPGAQLPNSIMTYQGLHNASTNSPALTDAGGAAGQVYRISVAGTRNYGAGSIELAVGDYLIHNGTAWEKADTTDAVSTVAGKTGNVTLVKGDVGLGNVDDTSDATKNAATATLTNKTLTSPTINTPTLATPTFTGAVASNIVVGDNTANRHVYIGGTGTILAFAPNTGSYSAITTGGGGSIIASLGGDLVVSSRSAGSSLRFGTTPVGGGNTDVERMKIDPAGVVTIGGIPAVTTTASQALTNKTLTAPRVNQVNDTNGVAALVFNPVASAVNYLQISNAATGGNTQILATGSDTNVNLRLSAKGNGAVAVTAGNGLNAAVFFTNASAVNYPVFNPSLTGAAPNITAAGSDTNISLNLIPKGTGTLQANGVDVVTTTGSQALTNKTLTEPKISGSLRTTGDAVSLTFSQNGSGTAVNFLRIQNAVSGFAPNITVDGTDTNIDLSVQPKGTGRVTYWAGSQAAAVLNANGGSTDVGWNLTTKGAGTVQANGVPVVTTTGTQTLTNKTLSGSLVSGDLLPVTGYSSNFGNGTFPWNNVTSYNINALGNLTLNSVPAVTTTGTQTLTNKTLALGSNTVSGTLAQFNTAVTDANLVSLAGTETLTNKTIMPTAATTTATGQTVTLASTSAPVQTFTGTGTATVVLPIADFLGQQFTIVNRSALAVGVWDNQTNWIWQVPSYGAGTFTSVTLDYGGEWTAVISPIGLSTPYVDSIMTTSGGMHTLPGASSTLVGTTATQALTNKTLSSATNTFPTFNQNTTGSAATLTTGRTFQTNLASTTAVSFNGSANVTPGVTGTLPVANGGTGAATLTGLVKGNGTTAFTAAVAGTDYVAPGGALGTPSSGTLTNCTFPTLNQNTTGNAATATTLQTARTINGVSFNGSANITVADSTKEPTITAGTTAQYWRGDKTWQALTQDAVPDGTTNKAYTATEKTKLAGIATAATANSADATLLARANHTGTQTAATISDFSTAADARVTAGITGKENSITAGTTAQYYRGDKTFQTLNATAVGLGNVTNVAATTTATASSIAQRDANMNLLADNFISSVTSTATAAGTTTLTMASQQIQVFTGTTTQTVLLPTTGVLAGQTYTIINNSTGTVTVQSSAANVITVMQPSRVSVYTALINTPTSDTHWVGSSLAAGKVFKAINDLTLQGTDGTVFTFPTTNATLARTDAAQTFTGVQTMTSPAITTPAITGAITGTYSFGGTPTWPTFNQSTTGSAATLTTARTIGGVSFNGSANIDLPGVNTAGTQNTTGSAATLTTGRTVTTNLASTAAATFNGSANITPGVSGTLPVGNGGTGATTLTGLVKGNGASAMTAAVAGTDFVAPGGALGTPSSGTLTNCTFPANIVSVTGTHAATLKSALVGADEFMVVDSEASWGLKRTTWQSMLDILGGLFATVTMTFTNKRITARIGTEASNAAPSINCDSFDQYNITALAANITSVTITGTPTDGQKLMVRIKGTAARTIAWGASFVASGVAPLLTTTVTTKTHLCSFLYDSAAVKWVAVATDDQGY